MTAARSLADLLSGCSCASCRARDAFRGGRWTTRYRPPPLTMISELQWLLYGYAVVERTVSVH